MSWNREGQRVAGAYLGSITVSGRVIHSRVKYGGSVQHTVVLDRAVEVFGRSADQLLLDERELFAKSEEMV